MTNACNLSSVVGVVVPVTAVEVAQVETPTLATSAKKDFFTEIFANVDDVFKELEF